MRAELTSVTVIAPKTSNPSSTTRLLALLRWKVIVWGIGVRRVGGGRPGSAGWGLGGRGGKGDEDIRCELGNEGSRLERKFCLAAFGEGRARSVPSCRALILYHKHDAPLPRFSSPRSHSQLPAPQSH